MSNLLEHQSQFVETYTGSFTILRNYSELEVSYLTTITFSWVTMLIEDTIQLKLWHFSFYVRSDILLDSLFSEVTMRANRLLKSMAFMMNVLENTEMPMFGNTLLHFSIIFLLLQL